MAGSAPVVETTSTISLVKDRHGHTLCDFSLVEGAHVEVSVVPALESTARPSLCSGRLGVWVVEDGLGESFCVLMEDWGERSMVEAVTGTELVALFVDGLQKMIAEEGSGVSVCRLTCQVHLCWVECGVMLR